MKVITIFTMMVFLILGCSKQYERQRAVKSDSILYKKTSGPGLPMGELKSSMIYEGLLPQEDSQMIQTTLYITRDYQQYQLIKKHPGHSDQTITSGQLNTERGFEKDRNAVVYILNYDKEEAKQSYFAKLTGDSTRIYKLDDDKTILKNYPLEKIEK